MININDCYNIYIDIPANSGFLKFYVQVFKNTSKLFEYDSCQNNQQHKYDFAIFNGKTWKKIPSNGLIDTSIYIKLAIKNINDYNNDFLYHYWFYTDSVSGQPMQVMVPAKSNLSNDIGFKIYVPQIITTYNPILYWKKSTDLDNDIVKYKIQLYAGNQLLSTYQNINDSEKDFIQMQITDVKLTNQTIYKWRVCAFDEFGQYSDWSDFYCFKIINLLYFRQIVQQRFVNGFRNFVYVTAQKQLLKYQVTVQNIFFYDLQHFVYVTADNQLIYFRIFCSSSNNHSLSFFVNVSVQNQLLYMRQIVRRQFLTLFNPCIFIQHPIQDVYFRLNIIILLHGIIQVTKRFQTDQDGDLKSKLIITTNKLLDITIPVGRRLAYQKDGINFSIKIIKKYFDPFILQLYNQDGSKLITDNRIKIYNLDQIQVIPFDENQIVQIIYPYVQGGINNVKTIYDQTGNIIETVYDRNGNVVIPYDQGNKIKKWINSGTYNAKYSYYNSSVYYMYYFGMIQNQQLIYYTKGTQLNLQLNTSGKWYLYIIPYISNHPMFNGIYKQVIYVNKAPIACQPPYFIDGIFINSQTVIYNSLPVFSFNPVINDDNDNIKYHLKISQDPQFNTCNVDVYLNQSDSTINYALSQSQRLQQQGIYYIYLATCDYDSNQLKTQVRSNIIYFSYEFNYDLVRFQCKIVFSQWFAMGYKLSVRENSVISYNLIIYKWLHNTQDIDKYDLKHIIHIYTGYQENDLDFTIPIKYNINIDLPLQVQIKKLKWDLGLRLDIIDCFETSLDNKIVVYKGDTQKLTDQQKHALGLYIGFAIKTVYQQTYTNEFSVQVRRRFSTKEVSFKCQVWDQLHPPEKNHLLMPCSIAVSNFVFASRLLMHKLNIFYPQPPVVVVRSNIQQKKWQGNYKAQFYLSLKQQSKIPFAYYQYVIDNNQKIRSWDNCKTTTITNVNVDLRSAVSTQQTGRFYFHVRSVNIKNVRSTYVTTYCIYYNHAVLAPTPIMVNGNLVSGNQRPVINYTTNISIYWTQVIDQQDIGDLVTYDLQVSSDTQFNTVDFTATNIGWTTYTIPSKTLSPALYYFRVRAFDQNQYSDWSIIAMFYVNKAPDAPTKLYVKNIT